MPKIISIIKYEGDNNTFIRKHPCEDFNTGTQLIVHESQEAVFVLNGQALDLFGPGRYSLETQNIPFLRKILNLPTGGITPFHCEVYFINKTSQMAIRWGTDSKIQYIEPKYNFPIYIGASGEMTLCVEDSRKLLIKLVGTEKLLDHQKIMLYFRGILMTKIKTYIAQVMKSKNIDIFEIDEHLEEFSNRLKTLLYPDFINYGVCLSQFYVTTIVKPDGDPLYEKFKELHFRQYADIAEAELQQRIGLINQETESKKMIIESKAIAQKRAQEGYTYQQERSYNVAEKIAQNEGIGNFSNLGVGLGLMTGVGNTISGVVNEVTLSSLKNTSALSENSKIQNKFCEQCGAELPKDAEFCEKCGAPQHSYECCTNCGYRFTRPGNYCPKCGAKRSQK